MSKPRRIAVVTGSRAEFGLLETLLGKIERDAQLDMRLIVTGSHLSRLFGETVNEIEKAGFPISERVEIPIENDQPLDIAVALGASTARLAEALKRQQPDFMVIVGDRYEIFGAAQAAMILGVPIAHIHGGEVTEGAIDDSIRHAITKMAHLHFVAAAPYRQRVIQMGELPKHVFDVGPMASDGLHVEKLMHREELERQLAHKLKQPLFVVTYHPVTRHPHNDHRVVAELLKALAAIPECTIVITGVNADSGHEKIRWQFDQFARANPSNVYLHASLGRTRYLSLVKHADLVVGNSSSGIIEAPLLNTPSVNIGDRQKGRLRAESIIDCGEECAEIVAAIKAGLRKSSETNTQALAPISQPRSASDVIIEQLKIHDPAAFAAKPFYDLGASV